MIFFCCFDVLLAVNMYIKYSFFTFMFSIFFNKVKRFTDFYTTVRQKNHTKLVQFTYLLWNFPSLLNADVQSREYSDHPHLCVIVISAVLVLSCGYTVTKLGSGLSITIPRPSRSKGQRLSSQGQTTQPLVSVKIQSCANIKRNSQHSFA